LQLLAAALIEKNENANITSGPELQRIANLNIKEEHRLSKQDFKAILTAFEEAVQREAFQGNVDLESLGKAVEDIDKAQNENAMNPETKGFFEKAAETLRSLKVKGK